MQKISHSESDASPWQQGYTHAQAALDGGARTYGSKELHASRGLRLTTKGSRSNSNASVLCSYGPLVGEIIASTAAGSAGAPAIEKLEMLRARIAALCQQHNSTCVAETVLLKHV